MQLFSFWGLVALYILANISGFVIGIRDERYYRYFHFTGGLLATLFFFGFVGNYILALFLTGVLGVLWEIYEWLLWRYLLKKKKYKPMRKDTINDLILDMVGGIVAIVLLIFTNGKWG